MELSGCCSLALPAVCVKWWPQKEGDFNSAKRKLLAFCHRCQLCPCFSYGGNSSVAQRVSLARSSAWAVEQSVFSFQLLARGLRASLTFVSGYLVVEAPESLKCLRLSWTQLQAWGNLQKGSGIQAAELYREQEWLCWPSKWRKLLSKAPLRKEHLCTSSFIPCPSLLPAYLIAKNVLSAVLPAANLWSWWCWGMDSDL